MNTKNTILRRALPLALCTTAAAGTLFTPQQADAAGAVDILVDIGVNLLSGGISSILGLDSTQDGYGTLSEESLQAIADIVDETISEAFLDTHLANAQSTVKDATLYSCVTTDCVASCDVDDDDCQECDTHAECAAEAKDIRKDANDDIEQLETVGLPAASWYGTMSALEVAYLREWRANETSTAQRDTIDAYLATMGNNVAHLETMRDTWYDHEFHTRMDPFFDLDPVYGGQWQDMYGHYSGPGADGFDKFYLTLPGDILPVLHLDDVWGYVDGDTYYQGLFGKFRYSFYDGDERQDYILYFPCTYSMSNSCLKFDTSGRTEVADQVRTDFEAVLERDRHEVLGAAFGDMVNALTYVSLGTSPDGSWTSTEEFCSLYDGETIALSWYLELFTADGAQTMFGEYPEASKFTVGCVNDDQSFRLTVEGKQLYAKSNDTMGTTTGTGARTKWTAWLQGDGTWSIRSESQDAYIDIAGTSDSGVPVGFLGGFTPLSTPELIPHTFDTGRFQVTIVP